LYTWFPSTPLEVITLGLFPDLGHSTLQAIDSNRLETYVSFWPDPATLVGTVTHHFQPPPTRFPPSYATEIEPTGHYMQRPSEESDIIEGLDESRIVTGWRKLQDAHYDIRHWNCSDVTKFLILHAMEERYFEFMQVAARLTAADMSEISSFQQVRAIVHYLATRKYMDSRPSDVAHIARVYNRIYAAAEV
jgi:hypothetical protein